MAWIESHQSLGTHRKTKTLARLLNITVPEAIGHLHLFWWWCIDNAPEGNLDGILAEDIAESALWISERGRPKDPQKFLDALIDAGFIDKSPEIEPDLNPNYHLIIHDWWDYAGKLIDQRELTREQRQAGGRQRMAQTTPKQRSELARQAAKSRWSKRDVPAEMPAHLASHLADDASRMPATVPNRTQPYPTQQYSTKEKQEKEVVVEKNVFEFYQENIEILTPVITGQLKDALDYWGEDKVREAITLAANANHRHWSYLEGIFRKWQEEKESGRAANNANKYDNGLIAMGFSRETALMILAGKKEATLQARRIILEDMRRRKIEIPANIDLSWYKESP
jgi:DnaD/phage-associated family protein